MTRFNDIERRVRMIRLVEKMSKYEDYCKKLGLSDESQFHGRKVKNEET